MQRIEKTTLMSFGQGSCKIYRIPGMIVTAKGTILVYCEGRSANNDWSATDIMLRRSEDGGDTWSEMKSIAKSLRGDSVNNPVMIASSDGTIHFLWEESYTRAFYQTSSDDGKTFSPPVELTGVLCEYKTRDGFDWNVFAFGPGHGCELSSGRLIVPTWLANGVGRSHSPTVATCVYSDDKGLSWHIGEIIKKDDAISEMNECCAVELSDGKVIFNIRNHSRKFLRAVSISPNGADTFSQCKLVNELPDPRCYAGMVAGTLNGQRAIVFSNCAVQPSKENHYHSKRRKLTLRLTYDDCSTWAYSRMLEYRSGYSDVALSHDGKWIYCFYEQDVDDIFMTEPRNLTFAKLNLHWLMD